MQACIFVRNTNSLWASLPYAHQPYGVYAERGNRIPLFHRNIAQCDGVFVMVTQFIEPHPGIDFVDDGSSRPQCFHASPSVLWTFFLVLSAARNRDVFSGAHFLQEASDRCCSPRDVPLRRRATCIHPFSSRASERGVSVVWHQVTCYGTTDVVSSRQPSARQRAICVIFQAPASSLSVS
jgi:hypothetical protein